MDRDVKQFIEANSYLIKNNHWEELYNKAIDSHLNFTQIGNLTTTLVNAEINPLDDLLIIPEYYCFGQRIKEFIIPNHIEEIQPFAFGSCTFLYKITIPDSVKQIRPRAFADDPVLKDIYYEGTINQWRDIKRGAMSFFMVPEALTIHCKDGSFKPFL